MGYASLRGPTLRTRKGKGSQPLLKKLSVLTNTLKRDIHLPVVYIHAAEVQVHDEYVSLHQRVVQVHVGDVCVDVRNVDVQV